jgi:hypothetical protein
MFSCSARVNRDSVNPPDVTIVSQDRLNFAVNHFGASFKQGSKIYLPLITNSATNPGHTEFLMVSSSDLTNWNVTTMGSDLYYATRATTRDSGGSLYLLQDNYSVSPSVFHSMISSDGAASWADINLHIDAALANILGNFEQNTWFVTALQGTNWIVQKSTDQGATWQSSDTVTGPVHGAAPNAFFRSSTGALFTGGYRWNANSTTSWMIRRSANDGQDWATVQDWQKAAATYTEVDQIMEMSDASLLAMGQAGLASGDSEWVTKRSTDGGLNWSIVDEFSSSMDGHPDGSPLATLEFNGHAYACGYGFETGMYGTASAYLRGSTDGVTWAEMGHFSGESCVGLFSLKSTEFVSVNRENSTGNLIFRHWTE